MRSAVFRTASVAVCAIALAVPAQAAQTLTPPQASAQPAIDGDASASVWKTGAQLHVVNGSDTATAYILKDVRYVYVAIHAAQQEAISAKVLSDDVPLSEDDTVALVFSAGSLTETFRANPFGAHEASTTAHSQFSPAWKSAGRVLEGAYDVTIRIPREALPGGGDAASLEVTRYVAAASSTASSAGVTLALGNDFQPVKPAQVVAGAHGKFSDRYRQLWPTAPDALAGRAPVLAASPSAAARTASPSQRSMRIPQRAKTTRNPSRTRPATNAFRQRRLACRPPTMGSATSCTASRWCTTIMQV